MTGTRAGRSDGPPVLIGSHIDTVVRGGKYDGALGVLGALEVIETLNDLYDYTWRDWYDPTYGTYVSEYSAGTLILDFIDADRNELAWRGVAEGRLRRTGPALPTAGEVDEAVDEIMDDFALRAGA